MPHESPAQISQTTWPARRNDLAANPVGLLAPDSKSTQKAQCRPHAFAAFFMACLAWLHETGQPMPAIQRAMNSCAYIKNEKLT
jgi:hypothetical protein